MSLEEGTFEHAETPGLCVHREMTPRGGTAAREGAAICQPRTVSHLIRDLRPPERRENKRVTEAAPSVTFCYGLPMNERNGSQQCHIRVRVSQQELAGESKV